MSKGTAHGLGYSQHDPVSMLRPQYACRSHENPVRDGGHSGVLAAEPPVSGPPPVPGAPVPARPASESAEPIATAAGSLAGSLALPQLAPARPMRTITAHTLAGAEQRMTETDTLVARGHVPCTLDQQCNTLVLQHRCWNPGPSPARPSNNHRPGAAPSLSRPATMRFEVGSLIVRRAVAAVSCALVCSSDAGPSGGLPGKDNLGQGAPADRRRMPAGAGCWLEATIASPSNDRRSAA